jgi:hypothetical protein
MIFPLEAGNTGGHPISGITLGAAAENHLLSGITTHNDGNHLASECNAFQYFVFSPLDRTQSRLLKLAAWPTARIGESAA